jgi:hypothetical protein
MNSYEELISDLSNSAFHQKYKSRNKELFVTPISVGTFETKYCFFNRTNRKVLKKHGNFITHLEIRELSFQITIVHIFNFSHTIYVFRPTSTILDHLLMISNNNLNKLHHEISDCVCILGTYSFGFSSSKRVLIANYHDYTPIPIPMIIATEPPGASATLIDHSDIDCGYFMFDINQE